YTILGCQEKWISVYVWMADHAFPVDKHHGGHVQRRHDRVIEVRPDLSVQGPADRENRLELPVEIGHQHVGHGVESRAQNLEASRAEFSLYGVQDLNAMLAVGSSGVKKRQQHDLALELRGRDLAGRGQVNRKIGR